MAKEILNVQNVTKYYGSGSVVTKALDGISFSVQEGDFTAIMGASGSGKSTLLNVIATIDRVSSGKILVGGTDIVEQTEDFLSAFRRDKLGFIFQEYNLLDTLTVGENIALPLNLKHVPHDQTQQELRRVAEELGVIDQLGNSRMSSPAANGSGRPVRGRSSRIRLLSWRMNQPGHSTPPTRGT